MKTTRPATSFRPPAAQPVATAARRRGVLGCVAFALVATLIGGCSGDDGAPQIRQVSELSDTDRDDTPYEVWAAVRASS